MVVIFMIEIYEENNKILDGMYLFPITKTYQIITYNNMQPNKVQKKVIKNPEDLRRVIFQHFQPIFKKVDQKGHDTVEEPELKLLISSVLLKEPSELTNEEFQEYKKAIDKNSTGKITYQDYFKYFFGVKAKKLANAYFQKFDKDHDRLLNKNEFKELLVSTFSALNVELTDELINWNLKKFDENGDGKISLQEYLHLTIAYV